MIKNRAQVAYHKREMRSDEKAYLEHLLKRALSPRKRLLKAILNTFVLWGAMLFLLLMLSGLVNYLAQQSLFLSNLIHFPFLQQITVIVTAVLASLSTYRWLKGVEDPYALILKDLKEGVIVEESHSIEEACRFQESYHGGYIYFLKVSEQDVFVVYDYQSQKGSVENCHSLSILSKLTLSRSPKSNYYLNYALSGEKICNCNTYQLNLAPEKWPLSETWCSVPWSRLESVFS